MFRYSLGGGTLETLVNFDGTNGANPLGALLSDGLGNFYGTTTGGGAEGFGTLFRLTIGSAAPEPASLALLASAALFPLLWWRRYRR